MTKTSEQMVKKNIVPFVKSEKNEPLSTPERLNDFIQNNRRTIVILSISIFVLLAGFIAGVSIKNTLEAKAIAQVEELQRRYEDLKANLNESSKEAEVTALVEELSAFASSHSDYAGARGYAILGSLYAEKKDWEAAEKAWTQGTQAAGKTYLAPVSLCNAAVAAEEQGNIQGAIDFYAQSVVLEELFPAASRAQFQIGRLEETRNNKDAALQAYRDLVNKWPNDTIWTNLAQSKIIALTIQ